MNGGSTHAFWAELVFFPRTTQDPPGKPPSAQFLRAEATPSA